MTTEIFATKRSFWVVAAEQVATEQAAILHGLGFCPANDTTTVRTCKRIRLTDLKNKDYVRGGQKYEGRVLKGHNADIEPKVSIRLYGRESNSYEPKDHDITFKIGDGAIYGGWNLLYTGTIVAIGEKTVKIKEDHGSKVHALDIATFSDWNHDYSAERVAKRNGDWMD